MKPKDYSKLNKQLVMYDLCDNLGEPDVLFGIAIEADDLDAFLEDVKELAVGKYGGAAFEELLDEDEADESIVASGKQFFKEQSETMMRAAEKILSENK